MHEFEGGDYAKKRPFYKPLLETGRYRNPPNLRCWRRREGFQGQEVASILINGQESVLHGQGKDRERRGVDASQTFLLAVSTFPRAVIRLFGE